SWWICLGPRLPGLSRPIEKARLLAEFDTVAENYKDLVTESARISGESSDYFAAYKARYVSRIFKRDGVKRILDFGCGVGSVTKHPGTEFPSAVVDGFDPSAESIRQIDDKLRGRGSYVSSIRELA